MTTPAPIGETIASSALDGFFSVLRFAQEVQQAARRQENLVASGSGARGTATASSVAPTTTFEGTYWERGQAPCRRCLQPITHGAVLHCTTCTDYDLCARCGHEEAEADPTFHTLGHLWVIYVFPSERLQDGGYVGTGGATAAAIASGGELHCTGYHEVKHALTSMTLTARFRPNGGGFESGREIDATGVFHVTSTAILDGGVRIRFNKSGDYGRIVYDGVMIQNGARLVGTWMDVHDVHVGPRAHDQRRGQRRHTNRAGRMERSLCRA